ncbi:MAG: hypothetical protein JST28_04140 [Acidobacteria bacterium]|nr:hypothetical protein [Acidobacteriota bacterium]
MPPENSPSDLPELLLNAYACYRGLAASAGNGYDADQGLAGKLVYVGELDGQGRAAMIAGNVAGCASLAATANPEAQRQAVRDGVSDFLVTSLDEALRILKNEIRKHSMVSVCVAASPGAIEEEMLERGIQPDFLFAGLPDEQRRLTNFGDRANVIQFNEPEAELALVNWRVAEAPAKWMPRLDAIALEYLPPNSWQRRWIRSSPRYLGRSASNHRVLYCDPVAAQEIVQQFAKAMREGQIGTEVTFRPRER